MSLTHRGLSLLLSAAGIAAPLQAVSNPSGKVPSAPCAVASSLQSLASPAFGALDIDADYYIFVYSASWCAPCRALMQEIVGSICPEIRNEHKYRVELVFMGLEAAESLVAYRKNAGIDFYTVSAVRVDLSALPGAPRLTDLPIPFCVIVDKAGHILRQGHGVLVREWRAILEKN